MSELSAAVNMLSGIAGMYRATGTLKDGTGAIDEGVQELLTGIVQLYDGSGELKNGTSSKAGSIRESAFQGIKCHRLQIIVSKSTVQR